MHASYTQTCMCHVCSSVCQVLQLVCQVCKFVCQFVCQYVCQFVCQVPDGVPDGVSDGVHVRMYVRTYVCFFEKYVSIRVYIQHCHVSDVYVPHSCFGSRFSIRLQGLLGLSAKFTLYQCQHQWTKTIGGRKQGA